MAESERTSYGQGALGETSVQSARTRVGFGARIRYHFDNSLSKAGSFVLYAFVGLVILSVVKTAFSMWIHGTPLATESDPNDYWNNVVSSLFGVLGDVPTATWADRLTSLLAWVGGTAVNAIVIGFAATAIHEIVDNLKSGRSAVISRNHTVILGWSNRIFPIISELAIANANVRGATVVIFANEDRVMMEHEIRSRVGAVRGLTVTSRKGDPTNPGDLARVNIGAAKSVIILDADETGDATIVSTVLAVKASVGNSTVPIVAEVDDPDVGQALFAATNGQVQTVRSHDIIARVTAQASRQAGLSTVILDLLDFDGDEIYFAEIPALVGKSYADALLAFNEASVIGFIERDGTQHLNPKSTTKIPAGARIIAIAEDDDRVTFTGVVKEKPATGGKPSANNLEPEHLLIIGWSAMGRSVLTELAAFLPKGSTVHIVATPKYVDPAELRTLQFGGITVTNSATTGGAEELVAAARAKHYDEVIVLGYRNAISQSEADAQTLLTMLQMNALFNDGSSQVHPTRLVAEILDSRKAELARVAAADDLVISDNLAALVVAQVSENPQLAPVFDDLFDAAGASVNLRPIERYVGLGKRVAYSQLVAAGAAQSESVIGYRVAAESEVGIAQGVVLNPAKHTEFTPAAGDSLIVVANK
jgi:Trk K+ transport system NAD-binding subunit